MNFYYFGLFSVIAVVAYFTVFHLISPYFTFPATEIILMTWIKATYFWIKATYFCKVYKICYYLQF